MSRVGLKPISLPAKVAVKLDGRTVTVEGPKGERTSHRLAVTGLKPGQRYFYRIHDPAATPTPAEATP